MTERESWATCNFTPNADGFRDYFVRQRKQMVKARIELFWCNGLTDSPISAVGEGGDFLEFSLIHQGTWELISLIIFWL